MTDRFVVKIVLDGVAEPTLVQLGEIEQAAAEQFTGQLRGDVDRARHVGAPEVSASLPGDSGGVISVDPRQVATIDLELAGDSPSA